MPVQKIPKFVFIVPYRDREQQQLFFARQMLHVLEDETDAKIYYIHQCDARNFNRGAMKNIGFLMIKAEYPNNYRNITLVFNDVDTMPYTKGFLNYETTVGNVKHFYGYTHTLGGIVSIKGSDFERIGGFPNYWGWGFEDNVLQQRVQSHGINIDRTTFYPVMDKNILQVGSGYTRTTKKDEYNIYKSNKSDTFNDIHELKYSINHANNFVNVTSFYTKYNASASSNNITHDIRSSTISISSRNPTMKMMF